MKQIKQNKYKIYPPISYRNIQVVPWSIDQLVAISLAAIEITWGLELDFILNQTSCPLVTFVTIAVRSYHQRYEVVYTAIVYCLRLCFIVRVHRKQYQSGQCQLSAILCCRRMFLAALISATKFLYEDDFISNQRWSTVVGLSKLEVARSEFIFLLSINHRLFVRHVDLYSAVCTLSHHLKLTYPITMFVNYAMTKSKSQLGKRKQLP